MNILGISCYYHDSAAALVQDGNIVAAAQEERFSRIKHDANFPEKAIEYCLKEAKISKNELDLVCFYDKPFLKFERLLETYLGFVPRGILSAWKALPVWIKDKLWISEHIQKNLGRDVKIIYPEHHESHAASAFFPSPFQEAAILTVDGVGEWASSSMGVGDENRLSLTFEQYFPHSLGLLYSAFTYYTGFKVNSGEYKVMGLAPYGNPRFVHQIYEYLLDVKEDGSFLLNMDYFDFAAGLKMTSSKWDSIFEGNPRKPESPITQREMDLAASVQVVTEDIMLKMAKTALKESDSKNLCLAGGVALNCVANGKILRSGLAEDLWIQPASGDAGGALGAALVGWYSYFGKERKIPTQKFSEKEIPYDSMQGSFLGPKFSHHEIELWLKDQQIPHHFEEDSTLFDIIAEQIAEGKVIGWFNGRMEFGPRALGARSILGDPRSPEMQKKLNLKIKFRESFRPFAPSILADHVSEVVEMDGDSPYMLLVASIKKERCFSVDEQKAGFDKLYQQRSDLPAITHVDYSARVQTVHKETNPRYYQLIDAFYRKTGIPALINTSFNVRGEPIVCTPQEAFACFMHTDMDVLVLENYVLYKTEQQPIMEKTEYITHFELD